VVVLLWGDVLLVVVVVALVLPLVRDVPVPPLVVP
jgi:hypothetical protein